MDDFGSGYSSLNTLKEYVFDELKIDMCFLSDMSLRSRRIIRAIISMAKDISSGELVAYLEDYLVDRKVGEDISIELQSAKSLDMDRFRSTYQTYVEKLIRRNKREIRRSDRRAIAALLLGAVFVIIGYTSAGRVDTVTAEIISAVGSFSMWAAIALFIETLPTLRYKARILKLFEAAEIRCRKPDPAGSHEKG